MFFLLLSILCSALNSLLLRLSETHAKNSLSLLACNYVMCTFLAVLTAGPLFPAASEGGMGSVLLIGGVAGVLYLASFVMLQWNIGKNGVALPATFMKLGVLVPTVMAVTIFHEAPKIAQILGILLAVAAMVMIRLEKSASRVQSSWGLVGLLLVGGLADSTGKMYSFWGAPALKGYFLVCTFGVALILCVALCLWKKQSLAPADVVFGVLIGIPNFFSSHFLLLSLQSIPSLIVYPCASVGAIVLVTLAGVVFFKEKLSRRQLTALGVIVLSLVLLNV